MSSHRLSIAAFLHELAAKVEAAGDDDIEYSSTTRELRTAAEFTTNNSGAATAQ